jgi:hypothetical protein
MEIKTRYERIIEGNRLFSLDNETIINEKSTVGDALVASQRRPQGSPLQQQNLFSLNNKTNKDVKFINNKGVYV